MAVARRRHHLALAECLSADAVGNLVYVRDVIGSGMYRVATADPSSSATMPVVGVIVQKSTPTICTIQFFNTVSGIYSSLDSGKAYVVGTDGTPAKPGDPNYPSAGYLIQQVGVATDDGELLLNPQEVLSGGGSSSGRYFQQSLLLTVDPKVFNTSFDFKHGGIETEVLLYNGQRLREGSGHDYVASESGGIGTGYDTITLEFDPRPGSNWFIDYSPDL